MMSNELNTEAFNKLSPEEKELAIQILKQYSAEGKSDILNELKYGDFEEIPVDIDTFLDNERYLGRGLWITDEFTGERKCTLFPYWRDMLHKLFPDNLTTRYNTLILTGSIGLGKSFIAVVCQLYLLYRMLCLKDPYTYYGLQPIDKITFSMLNVTLDAAQGVAWDKCQQLLQSSDWFMEHGNMNASRTNPQWQPPKGIELIFGSSNRHVVGRALFSNFSDECLDGNTIIKTSEGDKPLIELVNKQIKVATINSEGKEEYSTVCTVKPTKVTNEEYEVLLEDNSVIKCTGNHLLMLKDGSYKRADELTEADELFEVHQDCRSIIIKQITKVILSEPKQFYDVIEATPYHNFLVKTNSGYICTHNCNFGVGNNVEKQKAKLKKMISQIDARMISRFGKGTFLPTLNIIASSKDSEQSFLESYIDMKRQNESKTALIIDEPQWVIRNDKGSPEDPGSFWIAVGNKFLAHELLPVGASDELVEQYRQKGYFMLKVPPIYREAFEDNLDLALTDNAGISTSSTTKYISGIRLNQTKTDEYRNPFTKDIIEVSNNPEDRAQYANFFDLARVNPVDIAKPLFIHLDMSLSGDKTGIAGVWITGKRTDSGDGDPAKELEFKLAFSVSVKAQKGFQVSFEKNRNFIRWLKDRGFAIKGISSDTFQSAQIQQQLKADGFKTKIISVDRVDNVGGSASGESDGEKRGRICKPYAFLKSAIYERHIKMYQKCDLLTDELTSLERLSDGHIDHPKTFSKDQADAVCGALYLASEFSEEYSYTYGENLEAALEVNNVVSDELSKRQMILDFQNELTKVYNETAETARYERQRKQEEYQSYQDILDGIINI